MLEVVNLGGVFMAFNVCVCARECVSVCVCVCACVRWSV